jgi:hypothetical protein
MAILHACLDASGRFKDSEYVSPSGYISDVERWEIFSREWDDLRAKRGVPPIHLASVKDTALLLEFAEIIQKYGLRAIGVAVDVNAFNWCHAVSHFGRKGTNQTKYGHDREDP